MPRVSVIIPAYNCAERIGKSLDTVFAQSFTDYEIIVVDDGSTDDTPAVLEGYGDRIVSTRQDNAGPGQARNLGLEQAQGRYTAFLDSDDLWHPNKLATQTAFLDEHDDVGLCSVNYTTGTTVENGIPRWSTKTDSKWYITNKTFGSWMKGYAPLTSSIMVRTDALKDVGGFPNLYYGEDLCAWARLGAVLKWAFCHEVLCYKISHGESLLARLSTNTPNLELGWGILKDVAIKEKDPEEFKAFQQMLFRSTWAFVTNALAEKNHLGLREVISRRSPDMGLKHRLVLNAIQLCPGLARQLLMFKRRLRS